ncbi:MAG: T9SS type A sorting domain-containing protein [Flavobacteriaceae bacterium]
MIRGAAAFGFDSFRFGGQFTSGFYEGIDGMMDEVRLWNDVRTESEIRENMFKNFVGDEANLVAYYNLDNADGVVAQSYPAEANDGAIGGGATWVASTAFNTWLNTNSTNLIIASNWSNGIPAPTDNVGINNYSGSSPTLVGTPTVNNIFIGSGSELTLNSGFTVNGNLFLNDNIDLNGQTITLGSTATLYEDSGLISGSTGSITTTRDLNNISENVAGLGATITTTADMGSTVITRGHTVYVTEGNNSIKRYFDITPTNNTGLNATLTFNYDDSELNGLTESNLLLFKSTDSGTNWTNESGTVNTTNNTISLSGIDGFSRWTTAEDLVLSLENNVIEGFNMYPNPTKDLLFVNAEEEIKQMKIFNLLGQQLIEKSINSKEAILDLKSLPTGSYYILIYTHNTVKSVQFLIE